MSGAKSLINTNFNPMKGEDILFEISSVTEHKLTKHNYAVVHLGVGLLLLGYSLYVLITNASNPVVGVWGLEVLWDFIFGVPYLLVFLGVMELIGGIAGVTHRYGSLLYHHMGEYSTSETVSLCVTNYRLIYSIVGESGLASDFHDFYFDRMEEVSLTYPQSLGFKSIFMIICGAGCCLLSFMQLQWIWIILGGFAGTALVIYGVILRKRKSPYILTFRTNPDRQTFLFVIPAAETQIEQVLNISRGFKFGVNRL